jgi:hypothetical protein
MSAAWQRSEGKNPKGGLNAKGRASYKAETSKEDAKAKARAISARNKKD